MRSGQSRQDRIGFTAKRKVGAPKPESTRLANAPPTVLARRIPAKTPHTDTSTKRLIYCSRMSPAVNPEAFITAIE